ncbi:MAG: DinB family protein [Acidobacteria bacterium]|nr:DinB family protein [Acidobacteriota bacterium]
MTLQASFLGEFDMEMASTRKALERIPTDKLTWRPHEKSFTLASLAGHLIELPGWAKSTIVADELNLKGPFDRKPPESTEQILEIFDRNVAAARELLAATNDATLLENWTLKVEDKTMFTMPRTQVLRGFVLSHTIHHRGQLTVYLRLLDVAVPAIYGPTADEKSFF